ncbi:hypothetical protein PVS_10 [Vibrio phage vB_VspS_VS-ABTNL-3]|nr:hypothetical protein PVS_10 [Vibrio phage vB_VspS_VS-ABTNL-3]
MGLLEEQRRARVRAIISEDSIGLDGLIESAKNKAELGGIQFATNLPALMIEDLENEIQEILELMNGDDDA